MEGITGSGRWKIRLKNKAEMHVLECWWLPSMVCTSTTFCSASLGEHPPPIWELEMQGTCCGEGRQWAGMLVTESGVGIFQVFKFCYPNPLWDNLISTSFFQIWESFKFFLLESYVCLTQKSIWLWFAFFKCLVCS